MDINQEFLEFTQPLSPVLSSSKNSKKFIKNLKSNKRKSGTRLLERFETEYFTQNEGKDDFVKSQTDNYSKKQEPKFNTTFKKEVNILATSTKVVSSNLFQTASGKELSFKGDSSEYATNLFHDLFNPTSLHIRENKHNFLSNKISSIPTEEDNSEDEEFFGFKKEEYISSEKKLAKVLFLLNAIYTSKYYLSGDERKGSFYEFNITEPNKKRKFQDCFQEEMFEITQQDSIKINKVDKIGVPYLNNIKNPQGFILSQKAVELGLTEDQLEVNYKFQKLHTSECSEDYSINNIQPNSAIVKEITSIAIPPQVKNTQELECNIFRKNEEISLRVENSTNIFNLFNENNSDFENPNKNSNITKYNYEQSGNKSIPQFSTAAGKKIATSSAALSKVNSIFQNMQDLEVPQYDSTTFKSGNLHSTFICHEEHIPPHLVSNSNNTFPDSSFSDITQIKTSGFSTASGKGIQIPSSSLTKINHIFKDITYFDDFTENDIPEVFSTDSNYISTKATEEDKILYDSNSEMKVEIVTPVRSISKKRRLGSSLCRDGKFSGSALNRVKSLFGDMNFDDLKLPGFLKIESPSNNFKCSFPTPIRSNTIVSSPQFATSYVSTPVREVRRSVFSRNECFLNDFPPEHNCPLLIQKPTTGDLTSWDDELRRQKIILEKKLALLHKKQEAISIQISDCSTNEQNKRPPSYLKKMNKVNLKDVQNLEMQSDYTQNINNVILQINPQNAILIHFNGNWFDDAIVTTEDGCTLIPNQQGLIGLSEIEPAFCSMIDIKKTLIPNGWIRNHYKWVIWKLASYERFFPSTLGGCFTIDNVIKQLKYRYYKELFCAERPALRKIYEKDDISQKRMVLCISNIFKNGNSIELELTDGWYCIRTLIDDLLCHQINTRKIRIGSKLIMSGAELVNCEGCYPLEMEQAHKVRLKINFNSTRRAAWFSKLGYQKSSIPFLIKIVDGNPAGGKIGAVKVYIMRIYPVIYREKTKCSVVWRNQNAENKKAQEYENKCFKEYKYIEGGISGIKKGDAVSGRIVSHVFQMIVIDVLSDKSKPYKCTIWDATEIHMQQLKENQITIIYNVTLRSAEELSCSKQTRFEITKENLEEYVKYRRKYVALADYDAMLKNSIFGFFDTVGFVVKMHESEENQYFWLTDISNHLLLVKINEGPNRCLLLNRIREDQPVVVCNLTLKDNFQEYVIATASINTIVTSYPQYEFLQVELEKLKGLDKTVLDILLKDVKMRVNNFQSDNSSKSTSLSSTGGDMLNFSRLTSTDIVMSMIDIDDVVNNTK